MQGMNQITGEALIH